MSKHFLKPAIILLRKQNKQPLNKTTNTKELLSLYIKVGVAVCKFHSSWCDLVN